MTYASPSQKSSDVARDHKDSEMAHWARTCDSMLLFCSVASVFREVHKDDGNGPPNVHVHIAIKASRQFRYLPVKRALLQRHGLAAHFSSSHDGYWSCIRYCCMPSPTKEAPCLDRWPCLHPPGVHPVPEDCAYESVTAEALRIKRLRLVHEATEQGKPEPKACEMDVWALIVRTGIRNTPDDRTADLQLAAYAKAHCGIDMVSLLFKLRARLSALIDDVWQWEEIGDKLPHLRMGRLEALEAARARACECGGRWLQAVIESSRLNLINLVELTTDIFNALRDGRGPGTPVVVLAGAAGGEGKSLFFKPLHEVFPEDTQVFGNPGKTNFPLLDLEKARVAVLDEWRFEPFTLACTAQCEFTLRAIVTDGNPSLQSFPVSTSKAPPPTAQRGPGVRAISSRLSSHVPAGVLE